MLSLPMCLSSWALFFTCEKYWTYSDTCVDFCVVLIFTLFRIQSGREGDMVGLPRVIFVQGGPKVKGEEH